MLYFFQILDLKLWNFFLFFFTDNFNLISQSCVGEVNLDLLELSPRLLLFYIRKNWTKLD